MRRGNIAYLDENEVWYSLCDSGAAAEGCGVSGGEIYAMTALGSVLFVGGSFQHAGFSEARRIARWDGERWSSMGSFNADVKSLTSMG